MTDTFRIVVPTDFSEQSLAVLDWIKTLGTRGATELHLVNVVQEPVVYMPMATGTAAIPQVSDLERISEETLNTFSDRNFAPLNIPLVRKILVGRPAAEIIAYAKAVNADMIVIATRGQTGLAHIMLGSVAESVVRQADCAVLTVRA